MKDIVLNRMYNGDYLQGNLGHEIINLYRSDNGQCYLYLQALGEIASTRIGTVGTMLLVRTVEGRKMLEILGKAEGLEEIYPLCRSGEAQKKYIKENNITYGGVLLNDIFADNTMQQDVCISYKAARVLRPARKMYITTEKVKQENTAEKDTVTVVLNQALAKSSLKQYISVDNDAEDYNALRELIDNPQNWSGEIEPVPHDGGHKDRQVTMFDICGINDYELAWSNSFAYFMGKYPALVREFAQRVLGINYSPTPEFHIIRESENNIDLFIEDRDRIIVIENKIKSHINGLIFNRKSQELEQTQLEKYFDYASKKASDKNKEARFYLLLPNYNDIDLSNYKKGDAYKKIYYKQVYDFLSGRKELDSDPHLKEFHTAMKPHTSEHSNDLYEVMKQRFYDIVRRHNKQ